MIEKYSVAFLIPKDAKRFLSDDSWVFESNYRIPSKIELLIRNQFSLRESTSDFSAYEGNKLKVDVFKDDKGEIENIYFRFYGDAFNELPDFLKYHECINDLEFFVP